MTAFLVLKFLFKFLIRKQGIWFLTSFRVEPNYSNEIANLLLLFIIFCYLTVVLTRLLHLITFQVNLITFQVNLITLQVNLITLQANLITLQANLNLAFGNPLIGPLPNSITL
jgi:hypothetical protein